MQKPVLHIQTDDALENLSQSRLLLEVDHNSFSYVMINIKTSKLLALKYFQFGDLPDRSLTESIREIIEADEILESEAPEKYLVYNFDESSLVPEKFFSPETGRKITEIIYGNLNRGMVLNEKIPWWELYNVYRIPAEVQGLLMEKYAEIKSWHKHSLLLKSHKMFNVREYENYIKTIFYSEKIIVLIFKNHQLQLVQSFAFHDACDVIYHLLNCCQQFKMSAEESVLQVSGLIDRQSAVYAELAKYFLHFLFDEIGDSIIVTPEIKDQYPIHYYSSFLKLAVCV
jgi:hypothetical protein